MKQKNSDNNFPLHDYYSKIYRRYDLVNRLFTWGMDKKWRRETAELCLKDKPAKVIDLCCGTGDLAIELRKQSEGNVAITGYDFSYGMLDLARKKSEKKAYDDLQYIQGDAAKMPFKDGEFDALTIGFGFRNLVYENENSDKYLAEIKRILRKGAKLFILESAVPSNKLIRFFHSLYLRFILIPLGGLISGNWKAYKYLALSSANFYKLDELKDILFEYGFIEEFAKTYFMGAANLIVATKK